MSDRIEIVRHTDMALMDLEYSMRNGASQQVDLD